MDRIVKGSRLSTIKIVVIVAAITVMGIIGYKLYIINQERQAIDISNISGVPTPPTITTTSDLDKAQTTIEDLQIESSNSDDLSELDNELAEF